MGRRPRPKGPVHDGVLVVDKPAGRTSHDVVAAVRRAVGHSRVGHTGTLDPAATGVLVLCLGRATRLVPFLQRGTKTYAATMLLGVETDSQDADGVVAARRDASHLDERAVCEALAGFRGVLQQVPPMVSALKVDGERLHVRARRGEVVEREPRQVTVHSLVLDTFTPGPTAEVAVLVTCSSGTYVRTLAYDIGTALGVGGSLRALRRLANDPFTLEDAITLDEVGDAARAERTAELLMSPLGAVRRALPVVEVEDAELVRRLAHGAALDEAPVAGPFAVTHVSEMTAGREKLLGVYEAGQDGASARPAFVWTRPEELE